MLASSIVLVCRQRPKDAGTAFKRDFIEALEDELPKALRELQYANLSPVDLPQAAIGPGMAIFSRYERVVTGDMASVTVTEALQLINHELSNILDGQVSSMDPWTRFACKWFAQYGFTAGRYGDAETMANAVDVAVNKVEDAGIIESGKGKVRILNPSELPNDWDPLKDSNRTVWEVVLHPERPERLEQGIPELQPVDQQLDRIHRPGQQSLQSSSATYADGSGASLINFAHHGSL
jgi:putative DNA methylase